MATTSIWPINGSIYHVIQYIGNPDKTTQAKFSDLDLQSLKDVMDYAVQTTKTEQQRFVSGVNCMPEIARQQMIITKQRFGKLGGRAAYHAYQSFKPGETTPEIAHSIGVEFAEKLWGERFQVVAPTSTTNHRPRMSMANAMATSTKTTRKSSGSKVQCQRLSARKTLIWCKNF
mgnify:CR=1 FL=1